MKLLLLLFHYYRTVCLLTIWEDVMRKQEAIEQIGMASLVRKCAKKQKRKVSAF
jgi:hypothetical protein